MSGNQNLAKSVFATLDPFCVMKSCVMTPTQSVKTLKFHLESAAQYVHHLQVLRQLKVQMENQDKKDPKATTAFPAEMVRMAVLVYLVLQVLLALLGFVKAVVP